MKNSFLVPLALLASLSALTSACTRDTKDVPVVPSSHSGMTTVEMVTATGVLPETSTAPVSPEKTWTSSGETATGTTSEPSASATSPTQYTRTEVVSYMSPAGKDEIEFSVTLTDGTVTSASVKPLATNEASLNFQQNFAKEITNIAVGKKAADFDIDVVAGASLTTSAFEIYVRSFPA